MSASRTSRWRPRLPLLIAVAAVVVVALGCAGVAYMFGGSAPAAVSLSTAAASPRASASASPSTAASANEPPASATDAAASPASPSVQAHASAASGSLDGTWGVDTSIGSFSDFSSSFVGYRVAEQLANVGSTTAVGRTPRVSGSLTLQGSTITAAKITADLTALQSDKPMRDGQLTHQALETSQYPTATFELATPIQLATAPADGVTWSVTAHGKLTLHGVTKDVSIPLQAKLSGGVVTVV
ncbi:MAG TPA: YceI family protein, partial [Candidatus Limnocylindrales bacterium]